LLANDLTPWIEEERSSKTSETSTKLHGVISQKIVLQMQTRFHDGLISNGAALQACTPLILRVRFKLISIVPPLLFLLLHPSLNILLATFWSRSIATLWSLSGKQDNTQRARGRTQPLPFGRCQESKRPLPN
jgi:hypothetical protein